MVCLKIILAKRFAILKITNREELIPLKNEIFQNVRDYVVNRIDPDFLIVFGSYAKESPHSESDIDVAFYRQDYSFSSFELFQTAQELADIIKIEVDLVDLQTASTVFAAQVYSTGEVIYSKNERLRMELHMRTYSMYTKLNEERQPIIDEILKRGSVYEK